MAVRLLPWALLLVIVSAAPSWAVPLVTIEETFDGEIDQASWRVGPLDGIAATDGHPGAFLHLPQLDTAAPRISTVSALAAPFLGNYRSRGVVALGIDINLFSVSVGAEQRPVTLVLYSDMGTPDDAADDCEAAFVGRFVGRPGTGWKAHNFVVPSQSPTLPQGWILVGPCADLPTDASWNHVIQDVGRVSFDLGEPGYFYYFQLWDLGFDGPRITSWRSGTGPSTSVPVVPVD